MGEGSKVGLIDDPVWHERPAVPVQGRRKAGAAAVGGAMVLAGLSAVTWIVIKHDQRDISACTAVTMTMIERVVGAHVSPGVAGRPDGGVPGATMCQYGAISGPSATVFSFRHDADGYYSQVLREDASHGDAAVVISRFGYKAFVLPPASGAGKQMEALVLVKNGQYVNVNLVGAPAGAAAALAGPTAADLP